MMQWRKAWSQETVDYKCQVLHFLGAAQVAEGQKLIWDSLASDIEDVRDCAVAACMMSLSRRAWRVRKRDVNALWTYFDNRTSRRRKLAFMILDQVGELRDAGRLGRIAESDPDDELRSAAQWLVKS